MLIKKSSTIHQMTPFEVGWVVGIIEGEGNFDIHHRSTGGAQIQIRVGMTDKDTIDRLYEVTGIGNITVDYRENEETWKTVYNWKVTNFIDCAFLLCVVIPHLGERRKSAALELTSFVRDRLIDELSCKYGHSWTEESTGFCKTGRYCKTCKIEYRKSRQLIINTQQRARAAKKRALKV